jgi:DNA-binding transcriptional LysR family regulator
MNLDDLQAFVVVVERGSIVSAARSLNLARATLRRRLEALEQSAGTPLLHRTAQGVTPTEAGAVLATRGRLILHGANALLSSVREVGAEPAGELRFVLPVGGPPELLTPLFLSLLARYPRLALRVRVSDDPLGGLLDDVDVIAHLGSGTPAGWVSYELMRIRESLLASEDYLQRKGVPGAPEELCDHDLLAWESPEGDPTLWPTRQGASLRVAPRMISTDIDMLHRCTAAGMGIALLPNASIPESDNGTESLVAVLPNEVRRERTLRVVVPAALSEVPRIRAVLAEVQTFLDSLDPNS